MQENLPANATAEQSAPAFHQPRALGTSANVGAVAIEQERAIAEAQGKLILAKKFPRDLNGAYQELMDACKLPVFAETAFYSKPQGGSKVTGPSIRLAEEVARVYQNFDYGHRELSRVEATVNNFGRSEVEVYAWDMEKNNFSRRQITVLHVLDTREGPRRLRDQTEIDNKIANVASKQMRGRILALLPKWLVASAIEECKKTIAGTNDEPVSTRVRKMVAAFAKFGVNVAHLESYLEHKLDDTTLDELVDLTGVFNAIKDGGKPSDYFEAAAKEQRDETKSAANAAAAGAAAKAAAKPAAKQADKAAAKTTEKPAAKPAEKQPPADPAPAEQTPPQTEPPAADEPPPPDAPPAGSDEDEPLF